MKKEAKEAIIFFIVTILFSYFVFWGPIAVFKIPTVSFATGPIGPLWAIILFMLGGFVQSLTGLALTAVYDGKRGVQKLLKSSVTVNIGVKWIVFMVMIAAYYALSLIFIYTALGGSFDFSQFWAQLPLLLPLIILGPLSEEYGWRGFAIKRLLSCTSANTTSLIIGLVWSLWHLPLFYIVGSSQSELSMPFLPFLLSVTSSSFIYTFVYLRTNQSVFSAIFLHWVYTYALEVVSSGIVRSNLFMWLECLPAILIGTIFAVILRKQKLSPRSGYLPPV